MPTTEPQHPTPPDVVELGLFHVGEVPPPIEHTFLDIDFTDPAFDWTVSFDWRGAGDLTGVAAFDPDSQGLVTYTWGNEDMTEAGTYEMWLVVEDGTLHNRQFSALFRWRVV